MQPASHHCFPTRTGAVYMWRKCQLGSRVMPDGFLVPLCGLKLHDHALTPHGTIYN